jgi:RNA polymerase sigma factor (sigma-70 family)
MPSHSLRTVISYLRRTSGPAGDPEDAELLARYASVRDEAAFDALVRRHGSVVYGACRRLLDDSNDADDVFQATFVVLARRAASIRKRDSVGAWLHGVACRIARRVKSRAARRREQEMRAVPTQSGAHEPAWSELRPILDEELSALPEKYRVPLVLCYLEGRTWDDAARILGWRRGSMSRRLEKARELLRARLSRRGVTSTSAALAGFLTSQTLSASAPAPLHAIALRAALGPALPDALIPLVQGEIQHMALAKIKVALAFALALTILMTGAGWLAFRNQGVAAPVLAEVKAPAIKLPADPKAAVITVNSTGTSRRRQREEPVLVIRADGTLTVGDPYGIGDACEGKITPRELEDLLRFIIKDKAFFDFDRAATQQAVADRAMKAGFATVIKDASTTIIRVQADGQDKEVRYYGLATFATQYPDIKSLAQLSDIERRLYVVKSTALAGGAEVISNSVKLANESLQRDHPKLALFTLDDLQNVRRTPDGKTTIVSFFRRDAKDDSLVRADIMRMEAEQPKVFVKVGKDQLRPRK